MRFLTAFHYESKIKITNNINSNKVEKKQCAKCCYTEPKCVHVSDRTKYTTK